jgi:dihydropteroate synthase
MRKFLLRPICEVGPADDAALLAGGPVAFRRIETTSRDRAPRRLPLKTFSPELLGAYTCARPPVAGVSMDYPRIIGVLNVTPDSFSDGGADDSVEGAVARGLAMVTAGADFIDIGGESTRPRAEPVTLEAEQARVLPVIEGLMAAGCAAPISIDTRNAATARAALAAGAKIFNDISALSHDEDSLALAAETGAFVCLMHAQGDPRTMQENPSYDDVLLDVFVYLEKRIMACVKAGIALEKMIVDPGIGFGKTMDHNLALIAGLSTFQAFGCPVMLGASRKRFIGTLSDEPDASRRAPGSIAAALAGVAQGVQIVRAHEVTETRQALRVWTAATGLWEA